MTITNVTSRIAYTGDGASVNFAVPYKFFLSSELEVIERVIATGVDTVLTEGVEYTVTGGGGAAGTVIAAVAPAATVQWIITRTTSRTQQSDYVNNAALSLDTVESDFDRNAMRDIEIDRALARCLKIPEGDDPTIGQEIPNSVDRASKYLGFNAAGKPISVAAEAGAALVSTFGATLIDDLTAAAARATLDAQEDVITTRGDIVRGSAAAVAERLALGSAGQVLRSDGTDPAWATPWDENAVMNGCCRVGQRGALTLVKGAWGFGKADRMEGMATGTAVTAGLLSIASSAGIGVTGYAIHFSGVTLTGTGILYLRHRIEYSDSLRFRNGPATFQVKVLHDIGAAKDFTITIRKADVANDFSATTEIDNDGGTSVESATNTTLTFTIANMGSCENGIEIEIKMEVGAITTKNVYLTELQLVPRLTAPPFSWRDIGEELRRCQRYYLKMGGGTTSPRIQQSPSAGVEIGTYFTFPVSMRIAPTPTKNGTWVATNCGQPTFVADDGYGAYMKVTASGPGLTESHPNAANENVEFDAEF